MDLSQLVSELSTHEKVSLGIGESFWRTRALPRLKIPSLLVSDGPHGLRKQKETADMLGINQSIPATCFPTSVSTACSWDTELLGQVGKAIAEEAAAGGVGVILGPGVNMKRNPMCGRNFEYFSEDPYLAGKLAAEYIKNAEAVGVGTSLKHFACNDQEYKRFSSDSVMDERTLREIYLAAFEIAVREGKPSTVMSAYNKLNGLYCSDNKKLLTEILRQEWGFDGLVMTDWGGMNDRISGYKAGCDLIMPGGSRYMEKEVLDALESGELEEKYVDASVSRLLRLVLEKTQNLKGEHNFDKTEHHELARRAAAESAVLLKNSGALPIKAEETVVLIGHMAGEIRYQGAGSSHIIPLNLVNPVDAMPETPFAPGCDSRGGTNDALIAEAVAAAKNADVAVVFAGLPSQYESEGFDRTDMRMPEGHVRLIEEVAAANSKTVVVLLCGSPVEAQWAEHVNAVLYMGLPGEAGGEAAADLLFGRVSPSGKLAESWPMRYEDCPSAQFYSGGNKDAVYREGIYIGYRYYQSSGVKPRWSFGYGLSYTCFAYSDISISGKTVRAVIKNTGEKAGAEIVQLYIAPPKGGLHRPAKELKGFTKVFLNPGEEKTVTFQLDDRSFALWDKGWKIPGGTYTVEICAGVDDVRLQGEIEIEGSPLPAPEWQKGSWYENLRGAPPLEQWERMAVRKYFPVNAKKGAYSRQNTVVEMSEQSLSMRLLYKGIRIYLNRRFGRNAVETEPEAKMMLTCSCDCSVSSMEINSGKEPGLFSGLLEMANGHFFKGVGKIIKK